MACPGAGSFGRAFYCAPPFTKLSSLFMPIKLAVWFEGRLPSLKTGLCCGSVTGIEFCC